MNGTQPQLERQPTHPTPEGEPWSSRKLAASFIATGLAVVAFCAGMVDISNKEGIGDWLNHTFGDKSAQTAQPHNPNQTHHHK